MKQFLKFVEWAGFYFGFGMIPVYFAAQIFVMKSSEAQEFIIEHGPDMIYGPMVACLVAAALKNRLETTTVPLRDSTACGFLGTSVLAIGSFVYMVPRPPMLSGVGFTVAIVFSLFAFALSCAFYMKEERTWRHSG